MGRTNSLQQSLKSLSAENQLFAKQLLSARFLSQQAANKNQSLGYRPPLIDFSYLTPLASVSASLSTSVLPSKFDLRELGKVTPVKNQNPARACWAFGTYGSMESCLLPGENRDFSENNLKNTLGFDLDPNNDGGNGQMAMAYLTRWSGPIDEIDDLYNPYTTTSPTGLTVQKHVQEVLQLSDRNQNEIKNAIMNYGGVSVGMCWDGLYWDDLIPYYFNTNAFNETTKAYWDFVNDDWKYYMGLNHMVTIVGWDDNYSKLNFNPCPANYYGYKAGYPAGNGAWIVKNSWGTGWGDNGYFYVSYYDQNFARDNYVFMNAEPVNNYDTKYDYDTYGDIINYGNGSNSCWMANVFTATANEVEPLVAVGFYALAPKTSYTIQIYNNVTGLPTSGTLITTTSGTIAKAGYHTIPLTAPVYLTKDQKFSVIIKVTTPGYNYPIPCEAREVCPENSYYNYSSKATSNAGESFFSKDGKTWTDFITKSNSQTYKVTDDYGQSETIHINFDHFNACIKAYIRKAPTIFGQPVSQTVDAKTNVTVTVNASGSPEPSYQWYFNENPIGANSSSLTLNDVSPDNNGEYYVVVTNTNGTVTSQKATLSVRPLLPPPMLDLASGSYSTPQNVSIFYPKNYSGVTIRYTVDGKEPSLSSPVCTPTTPIKISKTTILKAKAWATNYTASDTATGNYTITGIVAMPTFSKVSGAYLSPMNVVIKCATPANAVIHYTINGITEPTIDSPIYTEGANGLKFDQNVTIKAKAFAEGWENSATATATYIVSKIAQPTFSIAGGIYPSAQTVSIKCSTPGVTIRYTTDGSTPTADISGTPGHGTIGTSVRISNNCTLQAIAYKTGFTPSDTMSAVYYIGKVATPTFTPSVPGSGPFPSSTTLKISSSTKEAKIYYTIDGTTPIDSNLSNSNVLLYTGQIALDHPMVIKAIACQDYKVSSAVASYICNVIVPTQPIFKPAGGTYTSEQTVTISCTDPDATIRYTTNGSEPTANSTAISSGGTVQIDNTIKTLKAKALKQGWTPSLTTSASYVIKTVGTVGTPTLSPLSGTYTAGSQISIKNNALTLNATIRYTIDGTNPTPFSSIYSDPITLSQGMVIKAKAFQDGMKSSAVAAGNYAVYLPAQPSFKIGGGTYSSEQVVKITCSDLDATIRYTTNGSEPTAASTQIKPGGIVQIDNTIKTLKAKAFKTGWAPSLTTSASYVINTVGTVGTPILSLLSGTYTTGSQISIKNNALTPNATIYYTTDGTNPTPLSNEYSSPITLGQGMVLKAKAFQDGMKSSAVATGTYIAALPQPEFSPAGGTYGEQLVTISCSIEGATIRYTTDGKTIPTATSPVAVNGQILVNKSMTIKAKAFKTGWAPTISAATAVYTINQVATPTFSVAEGTYQTTRKVIINCATAGAAIHYTLNGDTPTADTPTTCSSGAVITIPATTTLRAIAVKTNMTPSNEKSAVYTITGTVATPTFYCISKNLNNLMAAAAVSTYASGLRVYISCTTEGAVIHYTTDGTIPTEASPTVASGDSVLIESTATLKAKAYKATWTPSAVASQTYSILQVATPEISIADGLATIICATPGAQIRYTTNGNDPSLTDPLIASGSKISMGSFDVSTTLKVKAWKTGMVPSQVASVNLQYILTLTNDGNGTTAVDSLTVNYGEDTAISATPKPDYHFVKWLKVGGSGRVLFANPNLASTTVKVTGGDATIQATFAHDSYSLTVTNDGNGSTSPSGVITVNYGVYALISASPNAGFKFLQWEKTAGTGNVTFSNPNSANASVAVTGGDATIRADFTVFHKLTITNDRNGTVSPFGMVDVNNGGSLNLTATPKTGCEFLNWTQISGTGTVEFGDNKSATTNVTLADGDATIKANFTIPLLTWVDDIITGGPQWYCFKATVGTEYRIYWDSYSGSGQYNGSVKVSAFQKDQSTAYFTGMNSGYSNPQTITANDDYVYIKVEGSYSSATGNYAIKVSPLHIMQNIGAIAGGGTHSLALSNDGQVWAWGYNAFGQLGNNTTADSTIPVQVSNLTNAIAIAGGDGYSLALKNDGTVWAWGLNNNGQLGNNTTTNSKIPTQVNNLTDVIGISCGDAYSLALKKDGTVWAWGYNSYSQIYSKIPVQVSNLTDVIAIAGGGYHSLALKKDGTVWAWGYNASGQLGNDSNTTSTIPVQVSNLTDIIAIAGGYSHSLALKKDGTVWAWGENYDGELGNNTIIDSNIPIQISDLINVISIAAGSGHCLALKDDGTVWAWGYNGSGALGNGTTTNSKIPVQTSNLANVITIACGSAHSLALKNDGTIEAWGSNYSGKLGNGTTINSYIPIQVIWESLSTTTSSPCEYALVITNDGNGYTTPLGTIVAVGGVSKNITAVPNKDCTFGSWIQTAGPGNVSFQNANSVSTTVTVTGGDATIKAIFIPDQRVQYNLTINNDGNGSTSPTGAITVTNGVSIPITAVPSGSFLGWKKTAGSGRVVFGDPNSANTTVTVTSGDATINASFIPLLPFNTWTVGSVYNYNYIWYAFPAVIGNKYYVFWDDSYSDSGQYTCNVQVSAYQKDQVTAYFSNMDAGYDVPQIIIAQQDWIFIQVQGYSSTGKFAIKVCPVQTLQNVITIAGGGDRSLALKNDGTVWTWGANSIGQLYNLGLTTINDISVKLDNLSNIIAIAEGENHSLALRNDGTVWAWGFNDEGQLGNGTATNNNTPAQVSSLNNIIAIAGGDKHSLALKNDGTVWAWGYNSLGQLGNGTSYRNSNTPVQVVNLSNIIAIAGGIDHSLALKNDGTVWAWGENNYGQLGNGTTTFYSTTPVQVSNLTNIIAIAAEYDHCLALKSDGTVWAWGNNNYGQLGDGSTTNHNIPVQVGNLSNVKAIAVGKYYSAALTSDGKVWTWGYNCYGQLGNNTSINSSIPVQAGNLINIIAIATGENHCLALQNDGTIWAWGLNHVGQIGNLTTNTTNFPVQVLSYTAN